MLLFTVIYSIKKCNFQFYIGFFLVFPEFGFIFIEKHGERKTYLVLKSSKSNINRICWNYFS